MDILNLFFPEREPEVRSNSIRDLLHERYLRLHRLHEIARRQSQETKSDYKLMQCRRLIRIVTAQLNSRPDFFNKFNNN